MLYIMPQRELLVRGSLLMLELIPIGTSTLHYLNQGRVRPSSQNANLDTLPIPLVT